MTDPKSIDPSGSPSDREISDDELAGISGGKDNDRIRMSPEGSKLGIANSGRVSGLANSERMSGLANSERMSGLANSERMSGPE